jgi:hypothetical protein
VVDGSGEDAAGEEEATVLMSGDSGSREGAPDDDFAGRFATDSGARRFLHPPCGSFDLLVMEVIERRGKDSRRDHVENHGVDVRVSFDQSKHRDPLPGWCGFLFPLGRALIRKT